MVTLTPNVNRRSAAQVIVSKLDTTILAVKRDGTIVSSGTAGTAMGTPGDDQTVIAAALSEVKTNKGRLYIAPGSYYLTAKLTAGGDHHWSIEGEGWESTKLYVNGTDWMELTSMCRQVKIKGLYVENVGAANTNFGLKATGPEWLEVRDNMFKGFGGITFNFLGGVNCLVAFNRMHAQATGGTGVAGIKMERNAGTAGTTWTFYKNYIQECNSGYGHWWVDGPSKSTIQEDIIEYTTTPIRFHNVVNYTLIKPYLEANTNGIQDHDSNGSAIEATITRTVTAGDVNDTCLPQINPGSGILGARRMIEQNALTLSKDTTITDGLLVDSPRLELEGRYDSDATAGVTSANWAAYLLHVMLTGGASPTSRLDTFIGSTRMQSILTGGKRGFYTSTPGENLAGVAAADLNSAHGVDHFRASATGVHHVLDGDTVQQWLADQGGAANRKFINWLLSSGVYKLRHFDDTLSVTQDDIIKYDLATKLLNLGVGTTFDAGLSTDTVSEKTAAAGVTADGVLLKDGGITTTAKALIGAEAEIDGDLNHDGTNVGFYGVTPAARPAAYTQTYATATRTHADPTSSDLTGITSSTTGTALAEPSAIYAQSEMQQNFRRLQDQYNNLRADLLNLKQLVNQMLDDDQTIGLKQ